jgi:hypothetical protein
MKFWVRGAKALPRMEGAEEPNGSCVSGGHQLDASEIAAQKPDTESSLKIEYDGLVRRRPMRAPLLGGGLAPAD